MKVSMAASILLCLVAFSSCDSRSPNGASNAARFKPSQLEFNDQPSCERAGGAWRKVCLAQEFSCVVAYPDGGKACKDSNECEGRCIVDMTVDCKEAGDCEKVVIPKAGDLVVGACEFDDDPCGTFIEIIDGKAQPPYHVD